MKIIQKLSNLDFYKILSEVKVRFKFIDKEVVLEDWSELIKLNDDKSFKQVRFSPRMFYVPILDKEKLEGIINKYNISDVYLLAAYLSAKGEKNIDKAYLKFELNSDGLFLKISQEQIHWKLFV